MGNVESMIGTFSGAEAFNGDISNWRVGNVTDMSFMFQGKYDRHSCVVPMLFHF